MDIGTFSVGDLIVHEVPRRVVRDGADGGPILVDEKSPLSADSRTFFQERIKASLTSRRVVKVVLDEDASSPVAKLVRDRLDGEGPGFVPVSQAMAHHLYGEQTGVNPAGLLTVIYGTVEGHPCVCILKLEKEEGARAHLAGTKGHRRFEIEHLRELMLTEGTKVFKASMFWKRTTTDGKDSYEGLVSDQQLGLRAQQTVADFFLRFLGFKYEDEPKVTTKDVFRSTQSFINESVVDAVDRTRYQMALMVELNSEATLFNPKDFAENHMKPTDRQSYLDFLEERDLPRGSFGKNLELVASEVKVALMEFEETNVKIVGPPAEMEKRVKVEKAADGKVKATIEDKLKRVGSR